MISNVRIVDVDVIEKDYSNGKTNDDRLPKVDAVKVPDDYDYCSYGQRRSVE